MYAAHKIFWRHVKNILLSLNTDCFQSFHESFRGNASLERVGIPAAHTWSIRSERAAEDLILAARALMAHRQLVPVQSLLQAGAFVLQAGSYRDHLTTGSR